VGEKGEKERIETGYVIGREDVGGWIFEKLVKGDEKAWRWEGRMVGLTY